MSYDNDRGDDFFRFLIYMRLYEKIKERRENGESLLPGMLKIVIIVFALMLFATIISRTGAAHP